MAEIRVAAEALAKVIEAHVPPSRERSLAATKLDETVMWAVCGRCLAVRR